MESDTQGSTGAGRDGGIGRKISNFFSGSTEQQRAQRNRQAMLQLMKNTWVKGALEQSLHGAAMIELGLEERAELVEPPWDMLLRMPDQPSRALPPGTQIVHVFEKMGCSLLILGEPGCGKTTTLLELARALITRAERDPAQAIPVVLNLSSWPAKRQPLTEWLVEELTTKYYIPKGVARPWVENDELALLLDGLDEVKSTHRDACVRTINNFRRQHGLTPVAVCSRSADYENLATKLAFQGAVLIQPLTPSQVDDYLASAGLGLAAVRTAQQHDTALQELAQSPLMLSIMALAYQGRTDQELEVLDTLEARRKHLLDAYIGEMLKRRLAARPFPQEQTIHWLAWLAQGMIQHAQPVFLIELLQPSWLRTHAARRLLAVVIGLLLGLLVGLTIGQVNGPLGGLIVGLTSGVTGGLTAGLVTELQAIPLIRRLEWPWLRARKGLTSGIAGLAVGFLVGGSFGSLFFVAIFWLSVHLSGGEIELGFLLTAVTPIFGLTCGGIGGLIGMVIGGLIGDVQAITPVEALTWSWTKVRQGLGVGLIFGLILGLIIGTGVALSLDPSAELLRWLNGPPTVRLLFGLVAGLAFGLAYGLLLGLISGLIEGATCGGIIDGLILGPIGGLIGGLLVGLSGPSLVTPLANVISGLFWALVFCLLLGLNLAPIGGIVGGLGQAEVGTKTVPNQGIRQSAKNAAMVALPLGVSVGLITSLLFGSLGGMFAGLILGLCFGLIFGGKACIQHFMLRLILYSDGHTPWAYARFLDYAAERIFLRKVGGGYIFVHRLLMEHFAALEPTPESPGLVR